MKRNAPVAATIGLIVLAVVLVVVGVVYVSKPAGSLPSFFPGHVAKSATDAGHHHSKHGIVAFIVAALCLAGAWMTTGKKELSEPSAT